MISTARSSEDAADISEGGTQTDLSQAFRTRPKHVQSGLSRESRFAELTFSPEVEEVLNQARKMEIMGHRVTMARTLPVVMKVGLRCA
jgi:hypothetical protein